MRRVFCLHANKVLSLDGQVEEKGIRIFRFLREHPIKRTFSISYTPTKNRTQLGGREEHFGFAKASSLDGQAEEKGLRIFRSSREPPIKRTFSISSTPTKNRTQSGAVFVGAEKRIRTSGPVFPVTRFPIVLLKPLRHLCKYRRFRQTLIYITVFSQKMQAFSTCFFKILKNFYAFL